MTKKTEKLSHPYKPDDHNRYSVSKNQPDLYQCRVVVDLHGTVLEGTVYDWTGTQKGSETGTVNKKEDTVTVKGLPQPLAMIYQNDQSNPLAFNYGESKKSGLFPPLDVVSQLCCLLAVCTEEYDG